MNKFMMMFAMLVMSMVCFAQTHVTFRDYGLTTIRSYSLIDDTHVSIREYITDNGKVHYLYLTKGSNATLIPYDEVVTLHSFLTRSIEPMNGAYYLEDKYIVSTNNKDHTIGYYNRPNRCFKNKTKTVFYFSTTEYIETFNCCTKVVKKNEINWFISKNKKRINGLRLMFEDAIKKMNELK